MTSIKDTTIFNMIQSKTTKYTPYCSYCKNNEHPFKECPRVAKKQLRKQKEREALDEIEKQIHLMNYLYQTYGDDWYKAVEGTQFDSDCAKEMREQDRLAYQMFQEFDYREKCRLWGLLSSLTEENAYQKITEMMVKDVYRLTSEQEFGLHSNYSLFIESIDSSFWSVLNAYSLELIG